MAGKITPLKRRIAPSVPVTLELQDDTGPVYKLKFDLCFDMNAAAAIQERTITPAIFETEKVDGKTVRVRVDAFPLGMKLTDASVWQHIDEPVFASILFWAAILAHHPEYNSDEGLEAIRSYMEEKNSEVIVKACWDAYLLYLPKEKREFMEKLKAQVEEGSKPENPPNPAATEPTPEEKNSTGSTSGPSPDTTSDSLTKSSAA